MTSDPTPSTDSAIIPEGLRVQAAAIAAQQVALAEQELRVRQEKRAVEQHVNQLAARLDEKRQQLLALHDQLVAGRDQVRRERAEIDARRAELAAQADVVAERERLRGLRARFVRRWKKHWGGERQQVQAQRQKLQHDTEQLQRHRESFDQFRQRFHGDAELEKRRIQDERRELGEERARLQAERREFNADIERWEAELNERTHALRGAEQKLAHDRQEADRQCDALRGEARGLENRVAHLRRVLLDQERHRVAPAISLPAAPLVDLPPMPPMPADIEAAFAARDEYQRQRQATLERQAAALADQRLHLAELCERLAGAQGDWHAQRVEAMAALEELAGDMVRRDETTRSRARDAQADVERLRQEREAVGRLRRDLERGLSDLNARQAAWTGDRNRLLADVHGRERAIERRERAITALFRRWRDRRAAELAGLRQTIQTMSEERAAWAAQRDEWRHRSQAIREAMQAVAEQAIALEEARQTFLQDADRPAAAKRLERLRRRWAGLAKAARRELAKRCTDLDAAETALEAAQRNLREKSAQQAERDRELAGERSDAESQRLRFEAENERLETERTVWREQRQHYERQLAQMREEVERVARLLIDDGDELVSSAA